MGRHVFNEKDFELVYERPYTPAEELAKMIYGENCSPASVSKVNGCRKDIQWTIAKLRNSGKLNGGGATIRKLEEENRKLKAALQQQTLPPDQRPDVHWLPGKENNEKHVDFKASNYRKVGVAARDDDKAYLRLRRPDKSMALFMIPGTSPTLTVRLAELSELLGKTVEEIVFDWEEHAKKFAEGFIKSYGVPLDEDPLV
jgi:hypothetical protein